MDKSWMVVRSGWTILSPRGRTLPLQGCTWGALQVLGMEAGIEEEEVVGIETDTEVGMIGDMEVVEGGMIIVGEGLHLHTGGGEGEADLDHSPPEETDTNSDEKGTRISKMKFE